ncbi:MAG: imidazole glycerol phosphate synthase subunit HisH [Woeseiaceae bacterium]|nr:imidazole glycerol phosphate synthase subunit HisH [Woeseiaceae bacterium]
MQAQVAIVDSGGANIASLRFALERLGVDAELTSDPLTIRDASHVILPGVGAAAAAMARLYGAGLTGLLPELTQPVLGICLGMQLLAAASEEDDAACLGILPGTARRLAASPGTPVPHMGWSRISKTGDHVLLDGIDDGSWFYFVHSYALPADATSIATATHGNEFCAVASCRNFHAAQFHPERSAAAGARLLDNFVRMQP